MDGKLWLLEYAEPDMTPEDAPFVLNGSLFGACGTAYIAAYTGDTALRELITGQIDLYRQQMHLYRNETRDWFYYMLNPLTINQSIKIYIEINAFESLALLMETNFFSRFFGNDNSAWLREQAAERQAAYSAIKPVYAVPDENDALMYYWLRYAAPHPYMIDIKNTDLEFYNKEGALTHLHPGNQLPDNIHVDGMMTGVIPRDASIVRILTGANAGQSQIGQGEIMILTQEQTHIPEPVDYLYTTADDMAEQDGRLLLDADRSEAQWGAVRGEFIAPQPLSPLHYLAIEIESFNEQTVACSIDLYDHNGVGTSRYLPQIVYGKNLQIINIVGCLERNGALENAAKFRLRFYTVDGNIHDAAFSLSDIRVFDNAVALHNYVSASAYLINQQ